MAKQARLAHADEPSSNRCSGSTHLEFQGRVLRQRCGSTLQPLRLTRLLRSRSDKLLEREDQARQQARTEQLEYRNETGSTWLAAREAEMDNGKAGRRLVVARNLIPLYTTYNSRPSVTHRCLPYDLRTPLNCHLFSPILSYYGPLSFRRIATHASTLPPNGGKSPAGQPFSLASPTDEGALDAAERATRGVGVGAVLGDVTELAALVALGALVSHRAHRGDVAELAAVETLRAAAAAGRALGVGVLRLRAVTGEVATGNGKGGSKGSAGCGAEDSCGAVA